MKTKKKRGGAFLKGLKKMRNNSKTKLSSFKSKGMSILSKGKGAISKAKNMASKADSALKKGASKVADTSGKSLIKLREKYKNSGSPDFLVLLFGILLLALVFKFNLLAGPPGL